LTVFSVIQGIASLSNDNDVRRILAILQLVLKLSNSTAFFDVFCNIFADFFDVWLYYSDQWPGIVQPYVPTFSDGWSPPAYWMHAGGQVPTDPLTAEPTWQLVHTNKQVTAHLSHL